VASTVVPFPRCLARLGDFGTGRRASGRLALARRCASAAIAVAPYTVRLFRALNEAAPDLLHTNGFKMHILGLWARRRRVPVVWHVRDHVVSRPIMARLLRSHAGWCAAAVTNSHRVANDVRSVCGGRLNIYPIHDGIDLKDFSPTGPVLDLDALADMPPANPATVRVGLLATMARWKGHSVFLRALSLLPASLRIRAYVVGGALYQTEGSEFRLADLRALAAELGIANKVGFADFVDQPAAAMRALDIVVHASTEPEPFGRVIGEAMACGRAVIASHAAGAVELLTAGVDALTHPPGDTSVLAERIATLAANAELRASLGKCGRATAERRFDRGRPARQMIPIYRALTSAAN
jgi:glycosyltransferase involved in cell wall biosynthesis